MAGRPTCTAPSRTGADALCMDVVALLLGVIAFAALVGLIAGIERI
jgi:hypothetical protein